MIAIFNVIFKLQFYYSKSDNIDAVFLLQHKYGDSVAIFMMFDIFTIASKVTIYMQ